MVKNELTYMYVGDNSTNLERKENCTVISMKINRLLNCSSGNGPFQTEGTSGTRPFQTLFKQQCAMCNVLV